MPDMQKLAHVSMNRIANTNTLGWANYIIKSWHQVKPQVLSAHEQPGNMDGFSYKT